MVIWLPPPPPPPPQEREGGPPTLSAPARRVQHGVRVIVPHARTIRENHLIARQRKIIRRQADADFLHQLSRKGTSGLQAEQPRAVRFRERQNPEARVAHGT